MCDHFKKIHTFRTFMSSPMDREVWTKVTEIFDAALDRPPAERQSYVLEACAGNDALLRQVRYLLGEFEKAGDFLEDPVVSPEHALPAGAVIDGRYRIEALLGRGGMGEVYRAHDEFVDEPIALKTLRRELGDNAGFVRRFRREVQLARKVTHPNVCRVFEVGIHPQDDGRQIHFFTMELLDGETLAARIVRESRLSITAAYPLVVQMAEGLDAAHQAGIVHRDFKSANVMLCGDRAVITDFGLARVDVARPMNEALGTITISGQVAGTVAYMSPEQLSAQPLTTATDIYSLGIVLFEMVTGRLPFDDQHIIRSAMERATDAAPAIRSLAPELDARWMWAITRCLERDPTKRFSSARSLAAALRPRWQPPMVYWNRRQWLTAAGVATVGVALVPVGLRFMEQTPVLPEGAEALLIPIANSTGESQLDGISELFRNQLAQSARLSLLESRRLSSALVQMGKTEDSDDPAALREAAWRLNAVVSIFGSVSKVGPDYALNVQIETRGSQPDNPRTKTLRSFSASDPGALMRSVRDATIWVRGIIGESATSIAAFDRLPADTTTGSWEALTYYARGQQFYMKNDWEPALLQFRSALQADPKFTLAAMRLGDVLMSQNQQTAGIAQWRTAIAMLDQRPVTRAEELFGRGMFAFDSGDLESSERHFRTWAVEYPHDWRAAFYRYIPLCMDGHAAQALEVLSALKPVVPEYADLYTGLIACHLILGQTDAARELVPTVRRLSPPNRRERADLREASIRFREADLVGYLEVLRTIQKSTYRRGAADAMLEEGLLLIDAGYPEGAAANIDRFLRAGSWVETAPEQISLRVVQAWAEMIAGRRDAAIDHARLALQSESGPLVVALTGTIFARTGARNHADRALQMTDGFQDLHSYRVARHRIGGELAYADGRLDVAISELRSAAALEPSVAHRQYLIEALPPGSPERLELSRSALRVPWQSLRPPVMHHIGAMRVAVSDVNAAGVTDPFARRFAESSMKLEAVI